MERPWPQLSCTTLSQGRFRDSICPQRKAARRLGRWPPVPLACCHRLLLEAGAGDVCKMHTFALGVRWVPRWRRLLWPGSRIQITPRSPTCHLSVAVCRPSCPSGRMDEVPVMAHLRIKRRNHMWRRTQACYAWLGRA